jgi:L-aminopeptidase/D-esterase-like protein
MVEAEPAGSHPELHGADSILDTGGVRVGHWSDRRAATGCTVILAPPEGAVAACDIRGGAPGTRETDLLDAGRLVQRVHAIVLSGGSAFGLDAATGVMRYLEQQGVGFPTRSGPVPIVAGAVIFDLGLGRSDVRPDAEAGYQAARAASARRFSQGTAGAGTGATVAKLAGSRAVKGGLGSAAERLAGGLVIGALAVVNAVGEIVDPASGRVVAGGTRDNHPFDLLEYLRTRPRRQPEPGSNTTLAVLATNAALSHSQAHRLAAMAHAGLARTIRPSHTPADGDSVFVLSVGALSIEQEDLLPLGALGARAIERSVLRAVLRARGLAGVPSAVELAVLGNAPHKLRPPSSPVDV